MNPKHQNDCFESISLEGKNTGARMRFHQSNTQGDPEDDHCCCINIYVNNNVQGVCNSVLDGSEVKMRDPGVCLYFGDLKLGRRPIRTNYKNMFSQEIRLRLWLCILLLSGLLFLFLLLAFLLDNRYRYNNQYACREELKI
ncbi:Transmembrane protein [Quillaja saponaria]|uniref:Transmembrane protein n=1 Tax=Quillaja saponaria TaxID=32244 RepID=A0AAD7Q9I3_QUISA|nr:Transmembrane protein [Quillaja saponaria]